MERWGRICRMYTDFIRHPYSVIAWCIFSVGLFILGWYFIYDVANYKRFLDHSKTKHFRKMALHISLAFLSLFLYLIVAVIFWIISEKKSDYRRWMSILFNLFAPCGLPLLTLWLCDNFNDERSFIVFTCFSLSALFMVQLTGVDNDVGFMDTIVAVAISALGGSEAKQRWSKASATMVLCLYKAFILEVRAQLKEDESKEMNKNTEELEKRKKNLDLREKDLQEREGRERELQKKREKELRKFESQLQVQGQKQSQLEQQLYQHKQRLDQRESELKVREKECRNNIEKQNKQQKQLDQLMKDMEARKDRLDQRGKDLQDREKQTKLQEKQLDELGKTLKDREKELEQIGKDLQDREKRGKALKDREKELEQLGNALKDREKELEQLGKDLQDREGRENKRELKAGQAATNNR